MQPDTITIYPYNDVFFRIGAERSILTEISEYFTFQVPNFQFMPAFRRKMWDGKLRLFNMMNGELYCGLLNQLKRFAQDRQYKIEVADTGNRLGGPLDLYDAKPWLKEKVDDFINGLNLHIGGEPIEPYFNQLDIIHKGISDQRGLMISPTGSGKSLIQYVWAQWWAERSKSRVLIIVPTTNLVEQLSSDFADYGSAIGFDKNCDVHKIYSGKEKDNIQAKIVISTWQSVFKMPLAWFKQFKTLLVDEVHLAEAKSIKGIAHRMTDCPVKIGVTGTLKKPETHKLVLEGLFGPIYKPATTMDLIKAGQLSPIEIYCIVLKYPEHDIKIVKGMEYKDEMDFIVQHPLRNKFIRNLALNQTQNTIVLFNLIEKHGKPLYELLKKKDPNRDLYYVAGSVKTDEREIIRKIVETKEKAVIAASLGTFSTGVNIKNLCNIVLASPFKSVVRLLQSLGRGLRLHKDKKILRLYDIVDDLTHVTKKGNKKPNYMMKHFLERLEIYSEEGFKVKFIQLDLEAK